MERDDANAILQKYGCNFNSHAHVERDAKLSSDKQRRGISTHTLTWSVTKQSGFYRLADYISTHTLTWSVTTMLMITTWNF